MPELVYSDQRLRPAMKGIVVAAVAILRLPRPVRDQRRARCCVLLLRRLAQTGREPSRDASSTATFRCSVLASFVLGVRPASASGSR